MKVLVGLFGLLAVLFGASASAEESEAPFYLGAGFHFGSGTGEVKDNIAIARQLGLNAARDERLWNWVEWEQGRYNYGGLFEAAVDEFQRADMALLFILAYGNRHYDSGNYPVKPETAEAYCRFAEYTARHFDGRVRFLQVWNEWEGSTSMGEYRDTVGSAEYLELLARVAPRIRAANPQVRIISNSISSGDGTLDYYLRNGALKLVDYIAMHTYNFADGPGRDTVDAFAARMAKVGEMIRAANDGRDFPVLITEMGVPSHVAAGTGHTRLQQAAELGQILLVCRMFDWIRGFWWYDFQDDNVRPESSEANFGLIRPDGTPKESACVMDGLSDLVKNGRFVERIPVADAKVWILHFSLRGEDVYALFHTYAEDDFRIVLENTSDKLPPVRMRLAGRPEIRRDWGFRDWLASGQPEWPNRLSVTVDAMPLLISGDLAGVKPVAVEKYRFPRAMPLPEPLPEPALKAPAVRVGDSAPVQTVGDYTILNSSGPRAAGFGAAFSASYDDRNLYLELTVDDADFHCDLPIEDAWNRDSIQLAFQLRSAAADPGRWLELDCALTPTGPAAYVRRLAVGETVPELPAPEIAAADGRIRYRLRIPAELLGAGGFAPGDAIAFALLVNDSDGAMRRGYLHWADGIGAGKNPAEFGLLELR